jgi:hypothetical protein
MTSTKSLIIAIVSAGVVLTTTALFVSYNDEITRKCSVSSIEPRQNGDVGGRSVHTSCGVYEIRDSTLKNAKARNINITKGRTYVLKAYGWRGQFFRPPNIIEAKESK